MKTTIGVLQLLTLALLDPLGQATASAQTNDIGGSGPARAESDCCFSGAPGNMTWREPPEVAIPASWAAVSEERGRPGISGSHGWTSILGSLVGGFGLRVEYWTCSTAERASCQLSAVAQVRSDDTFTLKVDREVRPEQGEVRIQVPPGWGGPGEGRLSDSEGLRGEVWTDIDNSGTCETVVSSFVMGIDGSFHLDESFQERGSLPTEIRIPTSDDGKM